jgi:nitrogen fixation protein NifQ
MMDQLVDDGCRKSEPGRRSPDAGAIHDELSARLGCFSRFDSFTAHVFICSLTIGVVESAAEGVSVGASIGLDRGQLARLIRGWAPAAACYIELKDQPEHIRFDEEESQLRELFQRYRADDSAETSWLASILTRRSMSPRHLWQDLGLSSRDELSRLMRERFSRLAARNTDNMKWKKYFYRCLCELEGFTLCAAPTCRECNDFPNCFGDETGQSLFARMSFDASAPRPPMPAVE